jgi:hypothetical protein
VSRRISERFGQVPVNRLWTWARLCVLEFDSTLPEFRVRLAVHGGNRFIGNLGRHRLLRGRRAGRLTCGATRVGHWRMRARKDRFADVPGGSFEFPEPLGAAAACDDDPQPMAYLTERTANSHPNYCRRNETGMCGMYGVTGVRQDNLADV